MELVHNNDCSGWKVAVQTGVKPVLNAYGYYPAGSPLLQCFSPSVITQNQAGILNAHDCDMLFVPVTF